MLGSGFFAEVCYFWLPLPPFARKSLNVGALEMVRSILNNFFVNLVCKNRRTLSYMPVTVNNLT
jgi:hypothetical protein